MEAFLGLLVIAAVGACGVVVVAQLLRLFPGFRYLSTGLLLASSHSLILLLFLLAAPLYIVWEWGSPYGDVYGPYLFVPGIHLYQPASLFFGQRAFPWLLGYMESFPASVLCVIVGPGLVGLLAGVLQWFIVGVCWDRVTGKRRKGAA